MHRHALAIGADERNGQIPHVAVLEIDEEIHDVCIRIFDHCSRGESRESQLRIEALRLVIRDEQAPAEVARRL